jgi:hypothetical protein
MRLIMIVAAATIALSTSVLAQTQSEITNTVGSGTAKALDNSAAQNVGKPAAPSSMKRTNCARKAATAINQPGAAPKNGTEKPDGTTGAPPYGSSAPKARPDAADLIRAGVNYPAYPILIGG